MTGERVLAWDGCLNVRDLGGLRTDQGRLTRWRAVVRSDHPARLTAAGWSALHDHGIRTIISLRTHGMEEDEPDLALRPSDLTTVQVAVEDITDTEFVQRWVESGLWSTPLYYQDALRRWPERHAALISAVAQARPGGVLVHCRRGIDRTGIASMLLLALVGVRQEDILADYLLSTDPERDELLAGQHTSVDEVLRSTLNWLDAGPYLLAGGASQRDLAAVRERLLE